MAELSIGEADHLYLEHGVETVRDPDWLAVHGAEFGEWVKQQEEDDNKPDQRSAAQQIRPIVPEDELA